MRFYILVLFLSLIGCVHTDPTGTLYPSQPLVDLDQDGLLDAKDKCPDTPEDIDAFEDEDGCPDLDNDGDRFIDKDDLCPNMPEAFNDYEDDDGCPDKLPKITYGRSALISIQVFFEKNKASIPKEETDKLDKAAARLSAHPVQMLVLGFATPDEKDAKKLALQRAAAVRDYLVSQGVDGADLELRGEERADEKGERTAEFMVCVIL